MPEPGPFARLSHTADNALKAAVECAQKAFDGFGLHIYHSSYVDLVLCGESAAGPIALVAGSHTKDFPYQGTDPWDNCLLLVGDTGYTFTGRTQNQSLHLDFDVEQPAPGGTIRFDGQMRRAKDGASIPIQFQFPITLKPFPGRLLGEAYNFLELPGAVGLDWRPYDISGLRGDTSKPGQLAQLTIAGTPIPIPVSGIRGSCERGILTNLRAHDFAIKYDYVAVARSGESGYGLIDFTSHALHPDDPLGKAINWYLEQSASATITLENGVLTDGNTHEVYSPPQDDPAVVLFETVIDLGPASLQRQMIKTHDQAGNTLYGLREIFTAKSPA